MSPHDQWHFWRQALAGNFHEDMIQRGNPQSGFYRDRNKRGVAIWRDDQTGEILCSVTSGFCPRHADEIDELFGFVCRSPISDELYNHVAAGGAWPEHVETPEADESLPPAERILAQIKALRDEYAKALPNGVNSEEEDAKAANFAKQAQELIATAENTHRAEKAPFLEGGRKVDKDWKPAIDEADAAKRAFLAPTRDYRIRREAEERKAREAEIARQRQEAERLAREAAEREPCGEPPPPPPPPPVTMPPKKPTGLRTVEVVEITDLRALAMQIVESNERPAEFDELLKKIARAWIKEGVEVKGARITVEKRAA